MMRRGSDEVTVIDNRHSADGKDIDNSDKKSREFVQKKEKEAKPTTEIIEIDPFKKDVEKRKIEFLKELEPVKDTILDLKK